MQRLHLEKALIAYLWDDVPAALRDRLPAGIRKPQVLLVIPARWAERYASLLPPALATLLDGYAPDSWGKVERFHQPDGSLLVICSTLPAS